MLSIRLSRVGKKKQPVYRVIVCEKTKDPWGDCLEILGQYNPRTSPKTVELKADRIKYWIEKGAQPSDTVRNLLVSEKIIEGDKVAASKISKKRAAKMEEKKAGAEGGKAEEKKEEAAPAAKGSKPAEEGRKEDVAPPAEPVKDEAAPEAKEEDSPEAEKKADEAETQPAE